MKAAILTNNLNSFYRPMAEGLQRMFAKSGVQSDVFYDGLDLIDYKYSFNPYHGDPLRFVSSNLRRAIRRRKQKSFLHQIVGFDLIVVVSNFPYALMKETHCAIEVIRAMNPNIPIVSYSYVYLLGSGRGPTFQKYFVDGLGHLTYGLERFDHYLVVNLSTPQPLPDTEHPVHEIGVNFDDGTLFPEQQTFQALLDFPRPGKELEREMQIAALEKTNTKYIELNGTYTTDEIRSIYRKTSLYFVAFLESFGFPIIELQACGSRIFSPYRSWLYAHSIKEDLHISGFGRFSINFWIYNNDPNLLESYIMQAKRDYNPLSVRNELLAEQPHFYKGNQQALEQFIQMVDSKEITGRSHSKNILLNTFLDAPDYCEPPY